LTLDNQTITAVRDPLLTNLIESKAITPSDSERINAAALQGKHTTTRILIEQQGVAPKTIALALAHSLQLDYIDLEDIDKSKIPHQLTSDAFIKQHHVLPLLIKDNMLYLAIREPSQLSACQSLSMHTSLPVQPVITEWHKLANLITEYLNQQQYQLFNKTELKNDATSDQKVVQFVQHIFEDAVKKNSSDIHFEPYNLTYRIRYRIDGILHKIADLPPKMSQRITARLKMMSHLNIAEKRLPQDGRLNIKISDKETKDCRISTCPTLFGEKTVIRILENTATSLSITDLGMDNQQQAIFLQTIKKPQGMILVTGPTGSGKTLTLYCALNLLNTLDKNISTVEDPVEIQLAGINQVHVNHKANLNFPSVLRAFLRQDPDIIMIGEIRDKETADIAIKAAQTGHLILSTLHTNSAYETLSRLQLMGIATFNLIDTTQLIIAQRLVRRLCHRCKIVAYPPKELMLNAGFSPDELHNLTIYKPSGCEDCTEGYKGRCGIFEFLPFTEQIKQLIIKQANINDIKSLANKLGYITLQESVLNNIRTGTTSIEEAYRVIL
jgi:type IV pilus assembly protein PilB